MATTVATETLTMKANDLAEVSYLVQKIIKNVPKNVPLTDEEIQEECNMVRYGNKHGKPGRNWEKDLELLAKAGF